MKKDIKDLMSRHGDVVRRVLIQEKDEHNGLRWFAMQINGNQKVGLTPGYPEWMKKNHKDWYNGYKNAERTLEHPENHYIVVVIGDEIQTWHIIHKDRLKDWEEGKETEKRYLVNGQQI